MKTVTSLCFAAVGGIALGLFLLAVFVESPAIIIPVASFVITALMLAGAMAMARQAGTPGCLPLAVFTLVTLAFFGLLLLSWE